MNFQFLNRPLGSESLPFGQIKRYNGGLAASVFGSFISDIINSENVHDTNNSNYLIHQQDRAESKRQFDENLAWLKKQFAKEREYALDERAYQTPQQQVSRLRKAGINPALAFGQGNMSTPNVSSVGSAPGGVPSAIPMQSFESHFGENVGAAINAFYQNQLLNEEAKKTSAEGHNITIDSLTRFAENLGRIRKVDAEIEELLSRKDLNAETRQKLEADREFINRQILEAKDSWEERKKAYSLNNDIMESQKKNIDSQTALNNIDIQFKPALHQASLRVSAANIQQLEASAGNLWEQAKSEFDNRHKIMPLKEIELNLANGMLNQQFKDYQDYLKYVKDNNLTTERNAARIFSELFRTELIRALK